MKTLVLTHGQIALVDDADYEWLSQWKWHAHRATPLETFYARRNVFLGRWPKHQQHFKCVLMHRAILGLRQGDGIKVDHRDGKGLNNQRYNLRVCNNSESASNRKVWHNSQSGFKGVFRYVGRTGMVRWVARINYEGKPKSLGRFADARQAAARYDQAALEIQGEFACTNKSMGLL